MFTRLRRYAYAPIAALMLWAALLALSPTTANAQETSPSKDPQIPNRDAGDAAERVVVAPGDSLWSISERQLGPSATPQRIADGVERIYALNRDTIGADPDTIFPGQRFVLPPAVDRQAPEPGTAAPARGVTGPAKVVPTSRAGQSGPDGAFGTTVGLSDGGGGKAPNPAVEQAPLPDEAAAAPVPLVRSLALDNAARSPATSYLRNARSVVSSASSVSVEFFAADDPYAGRRLLGWALMLTSLGIGAAALALPIVRAARRAIVRRERIKRYRSAYGDGAYAAPFVAVGDLRSGAVPKEATRPASSEENEPRADSGTSRNGGGSLDDARRHAGVAAIARSKQERLRRPQTRGVRREPRGSVATGDRRGRVQRTRFRAMNRRKNTMGDDLKEPGASHEYKIGEPLRRSLEQLPLQPGAPTREGLLSELKPQVEGELRTLTLVERRRPLLGKERRQAHNLRELLTAIEETLGDGRQT